MSTGTAAQMSTYFRVLDGVRVRFAGTRADSGTTVLMLAPRPESLRAFRRIWDRVTSPGRVVALDMPGFGHSDQPPELIAPDSSGAFLAGLIDRWGLGAPHIVGPDVGTAAALFPAARAPERVTSLTIGGGAVRYPIEAGGALKDIIEAPGLDDVRGLDARTSIGYAVQPAAPGETEPEVHEDYVSAYDLGRFAESARFVRHYPRAEPGAPGPAAGDHDPGPDRRRPERRPRAVAEQPVSRPAPASQRDSPARRRSLRMGAGGGRVRPAGRRVGQRRVPARHSRLRRQERTSCPPAPEAGHRGSG